MMKKYLLLAAIALSSVAAKAQIGSTTSRSITTTTHQVTKTEVVEEKKEKAYLSRIQLGYNGQRYNWSSSSYDEKSFGHGFNMGYLAHIRVAKKAPLYVYTGLLAKADFASSCDFASLNNHFAIEMPFGATYRVRMGDTKIYASPYAGLHLKFNCVWNDEDGDSAFDEDYYGDGAKPVQLGGQMGFNFDLGAFYWNFELNGDLNKAYKYKSIKCGTMAIQFGFGFVF